MRRWTVTRIFFRHRLVGVTSSGGCPAREPSKAKSQHFKIQERRARQLSSPPPLQCVHCMSDHIQAEAASALETGYTRRSWHLALIYILGTLMGLALAIPTLLYLLVPPRQRSRAKWIDAGDVSQLTPGSPVEMSFQESRMDGWRVLTEKKTAWVVKEPDNRIVAFGPQCTHLGCAYHWEDASKRFVCPCHASYFSIQGQVLSGPAPRPLDRYATKVENNRLQIGDLISPNRANA
jgi:menaquinol-cytochrome c reductase iron-sulfur subunit